MVKFELLDGRSLFLSFSLFICRGGDLYKKLLMVHEFPGGHQKTHINIFIIFIYILNINIFHRSPRNSLQQQQIDFTFLHFLQKKQGYSALLCFLSALNKIKFISNIIINIYIDSLFIHLVFSKIININKHYFSLFNFLFSFYLLSLLINDITNKINCFKRNKNDRCQLISKIKQSNSNSHYFFLNITLFISHSFKLNNNITSSIFTHSHHTKISIIQLFHQINIYIPTPCQSHQHQWMIHLIICSITPP